ncbi:MAG: diguanylate cyclase [Thermoanaerobaculia bacterium]
MLPIGVELILVATLVAPCIDSLRLRARERSLARQLEVREREVHFLGESPDPRVILRHAHEAAQRILPVTRFDLYRVDASGRVHEVWRLPSGENPTGPVRDDAHRDLGREVDPNRVLEFTATETERSFAPRELLPGAPPSTELRLPLYSGDRFVAFLDLGSSQPIDDERKAELSALLGPLTASLHAARNWTIAVQDELSGLASRRYFETRLAEEWSRHERYGSSLAVACFDLDSFKRLNDSLGHEAGDLAIRRFGEIARAEIRSTDVACRYGGEEFAIAFPESGASAARGVAERIRRSVERERLVYGGRRFRVTVSAGVAEARPGPGDRARLLIEADRALYRAKQGGRNRVVVRREEATETEAVPAALPAAARRRRR